MKIRNQKGLSQIIVTMIIVILVLGATSIVFSVIKNLVEEEIESSEACFGNFGKITINKQYTCHDFNSNEIQFLINVGDVDIDGFLVSVSGNTGAKSFKITDESISFVKTYNGTYGEVINSPNKNSGFTYIINLSEINIGSANSITIAPIIDGKQCEVSDSLSRIDDCRSLA